MSAEGGRGKNAEPSVAHAKGVLLSGTFTPTPLAAHLSRAEHFTSPSTKVIARFSSSTGLPQISDTDPNSNPRGLAVRFLLPPSSEGKRRHTDIVAHSTPRFPVRTGPEFLAFFHAVQAGPSAVGAFLDAHPAAAAFVGYPKPFPVDLGREAFYSVSAFKFVSDTGKETYVRYRFVPPQGTKYLSAEEVEGKGADYLFGQVEEAVKTTGVEFKLVVQLAQEGDVVDDATVVWPEDRELVELGTIRLDGVVRDNAEEQRKIIFDPVPRVDGVEPSGDSLIDVRAAAYLVSGKERRAAK